MLGIKTMLPTTLFIHVFIFPIFITGNGKKMSNLHEIIQIVLFSFNSGRLLIESILRHLKRTDSKKDCFIYLLIYIPVYY